MLNSILPARVDNRYRGHVPALSFLAPITFMRAAVSLVHIFRADGGAQSISTMPPDTYWPSRIRDVVGHFTRMRLAQPVLSRPQRSPVRLVTSWELASNHRRSSS